jgi:hypothetical protein
LTNLVTAIDLAQRANEERIAAEISPPKPKLDDTESLLLLRHFAGFCKQRGVKFCPARPATVAAFIRSEAAIGVPPARLFAAMLAIEALHDTQNEANPVACAAPRAELTRVVEADETTSEDRAKLAQVLDVRPPESWSASERLFFNDLPVEVKEVIYRRDQQQRLAVRRSQNEAAELRHKLKSLQQKEMENAEVQSK